MFTNDAWDKADGQSVSLIRAPLCWSGEMWDINHPLDFLGYEDGAGVRAGPGISIGSALALKGTDRLPVAVIGDGDYMMGVHALWTAANARIPFLMVVDVIVQTGYSPAMTSGLTRSQD